MKKQIWGEWPSGLRHYILNWKDSSSNPTRCSAGLWHSSDPPFLKGEVNFIYLPWRGGIWKLKKGWKYGVGEGPLKRRGWLFSYFIFSRFIIFTFRIYNCVMHLKKNYYHNSMKKVILKCLKMNLKISHKIR